MIKFKRPISSILVITMLLSLLAFIPVGAAKADSTTYTYDGYSVEYSASSSWGNSQTAGVKITNTGANSINNWAIKFSTPNKIDNIWNAVIHSHENGEYIIKNASKNSEIKPKQTVNFGCTVTGDKSVPSAFEMVSKAAEKLDGYDVQYKISSEWGKNFEANVTVMNTTDKPIEGWGLSFNGNFTIKNIWNAKVAESADNKHSVRSLDWNSSIPAKSSVSFGFSGIKPTSDKAVLEGFSLAETVISTVIDWENTTDTDSDGLPDVYEVNITKTDPKKADTDGDKLPDGYEVFTLGTDPSVTDSDKNGTTDDMEDNDSDGLTNYQEFTNQTDPNSNDSDGDGLFDGDEINVHKTNPLLFDTDSDKIGDGDEIKLGLDPSTQYTTSGILDSEVMFEQNISSTITESVNTSDNPFTVNIDVTATGYADSNLTVEQSGYTSVISDNKAIQGMPIELTYDNGSVEKVRVKFDLDSNLVANASSERKTTSTPLEQYHIFRFDEENNLLYPVNTIEEGNSIYTESDKLGTYCVMDLMEWNKSLQSEQPVPMLANINIPAADSSEVEADVGIETDPSVPQEPLTDEEQQARIAEMENQIQATMDELQISENQVRRGRSATIERPKMDFVVAIDSTGSMKVSTDSVSDHYLFSIGSQARFLVLRLLISLNRQDIDWRMCLMDYRLYPNSDARTIYPAPDGSDWFTNSADVTTALMEIETKTKVARETRQTPWDALGYAVNNVKFRDGAVRHTVLLTDQPYENNNRYGIKDILEMTDSLESNGIYAHHLTPVFELNSYRTLRKTKGVFWYFFDDFILEFPQKVVDDMLAKPMKELPSDTTDVKVVTSYGLETIDTSKLLGVHLTEDFDSDGIDNMAEINLEVLQNANSFIDLITLKEFSAKIDPSSIDGFTKELLEKYASLLVLPLKSDPRKKDSDGDSYTYRGESYDYSDKNDPTPLCNDVTISKLSNSDEFVKIQGEHDKPYYGGAQSWFDDLPLVAKSGCGTVAAANVFAYLAAQNPEKYGRLYAGDPNNITQDDFENHMKRTLEHIAPILGALGVWPMSTFVNDVKDYSMQYNYLIPLEHHGVEQLCIPTPIPESINSYKNSAKKLINTALSKDSPVALLIGLNNDLRDTVITYPNGTSVAEKIERHWVTITEMRNDRISGINDLKISTWGGYAHINLNDVIDGESLYNCFVYFE